jgi:hypothetical protein
MNKCACGSYAINQHSHGRTVGIDADLCDVCYWRKRAAVPPAELPEFKGNLTARIVLLESAIRQTLEENGHLADGENCTLINLKRALEC